MALPKWANEQDDSPDVEAEGIANEYGYTLSEGSTSSSRPPSRRGLPTFANERDSAKALAEADKGVAYKFNPTTGGYPVGIDHALIMTSPLLSEDLPPYVPLMAKTMEATADGWKYIQSDASLGSKINTVFKSAHDVLRTPEMIEFSQWQFEGYLEQADENPDITELGLRMRYGTSEAVVAALGEHLGAEKPSEADKAGQNVIVFNTEWKKSFSSGEMDLINSIFLSVPGYDQPAGSWEAPEVEEETGGGLWGWLKRTWTGGGVVGDMDEYGEIVWGNQREELAANATLWLRDRGVSTEDDRKDFFVYLWQMAQQKTSEADARKSHLGALGVALDAPKDLVTYGVNEAVIALYKAPGEALDLSKVSLGQNAALWAGFGPGDETPGFLRGRLGAVVEMHAKAFDLGISIYGAPITALMRATGNKDAWFGLDIAEPFVEELRGATTYEMMSGGIDLTSWLLLDPINYLAGAGFGAKAAKSIPRAADLTKGRAFMQALVPFYGANSLGVSGGLTARVSYTALSATWDEMVDAARATTRGKTLYQSMQGFETLDEAVRKIPVFQGNEQLAGVLFDAAQVGKNEDYFWETLRWAGHGFNDKKVNPAAMERLTGLMGTADNKFNQATQRALDSQDISIRSVIRPEAGVHASDVDPYILTRGSDEAVELAEDAFDAGVEASLLNIGPKADPNINPRLLKGPRMANQPLVGEFAVKNGRIEIRGAGDTFAAFADGEFIGMVRNAKSVDRQVAVMPEWRRRGVGTLLRSMGGENLPRAKAVSPVAEIAFYGADAPSARRYGIMTKSLEEGDGVKKTIINRKNGWEEISGNNVKLNAWLYDQDNQVATDLAAKLYNTGDEVKPGQMGLFDVRFSELSPEEISFLERYVNDVSNKLDAIRIGDEVFVGKRADSKMIHGYDTGKATKLEDIGEIKNTMYDQAWAHTIRSQLGRRKHEFSLVNQMPRVKKAQVAYEAIGRWTGLSSKTKVGRFFRGFSAGIKYAAPTDVNWEKPSQGGADLRRLMKILGVTPELVDDVMTDWWRAESSEARRAVYINSIKKIGDEVQIPGFKYELMSWENKQGVQSYFIDIRGNQIGAAETLDGTLTVKPLLQSQMAAESRLPNVYQLARMRRRYAMAKRLPKKLTVGWRNTKRDRKALVSAYKNHLTSRYGVKNMDELRELPQFKHLTDDELLNVAFADVLGFGGRADGLGPVNAITSVASNFYRAFHNIFTIGMLAFRPFAWTSRVGLEEHARAWMMNLPSMMRNPAMYMASFWDKHIVNAIPRQVVRQKAAAERATKGIWDEAAGLSPQQATYVAEQILPGFTLKAKKAGISSGDSMHLRAMFSHDLAEALTQGKEFRNIGSRVNISRRTMRRGKKLTARTERLEELYGIKGLEFAFEEDVAEIVNKSNVWLFGPEWESSTVQLSLQPNTRAQSVPVYASSYQKKVAQIVNDQAGKLAMKRMLERGASKQGHTSVLPENFIHSPTWLNLRENVIDVARADGVPAARLADDVAMAEYYLDDILADRIIDSMFRGFWEDDPSEKFRILSELLTTGEFKVSVNGVDHVLNTNRKHLGDKKRDWVSFFSDTQAAGKTDLFPDVAGYFDPLYTNRQQDKNMFRRFTDWALQTFGEDVSQNFHRQPAYMAERRRWYGNLKRMGWNDADAAHYAHQKAFEMVNYTFFNNQHMGSTIKRLNGVIPFFGAWAEVITTWAWKIPSQNYLPLGYARMLHSIDRIMQGFVKTGLVEVGEDGQWHANLAEDPTGMTPVGRGLSRSVHGMMTTPLTVIEHLANTGRWALSGFDGDDFKEVDFSAWTKDKYQISIGSPVRINDHGIMGVNQFQFGLGPLLNYATSSVMRLIPYAGDTELIEGATMADVMEKIPSDMSPQEVILLNKRILVDKLGPDVFDMLVGPDARNVDLSKISAEGLSLQVPGSSWLDSVIDDTFFPYGHVDSPFGAIREVVPSGVSYMLRGMGLLANDVTGMPGFIEIITDNLGEYQVSAEVAKQLIHLEASEGLITEAGNISMEIAELARLSGFETIEEFKDAVTPGSEESIQLANLEEDLRLLDLEIMKRASDNAGWALFARGLMGFFAPAAPRMYHDEQRVTSSWWTAKQMAEAGAVRGGGQWAEALKNVEVKDYEDFDRFTRSVGLWAADPTGDTAKSWFLETYPSLGAWTQGTTFWGPGGAPPSVRGLDAAFDQIEDGRRQVYPPDVLMQRIMRASVAGSFETRIRNTFGQSDEMQGQRILEDWGTYQDMREEYRMGLKGLDMWDAELNGGSFDKWRDSNPEDDLTLYERMEEDLYEIQDAMDEILALGDIMGLDPEDMDNMRSMMGQISRGWRDALEEALGDIKSDDAFRNPREEFIALYFLQVVGPYYEDRQKIYDKLDTAETKEERSLVFEEARDLENEMFLNTSFITRADGQRVSVVNELERTWSMRSEDERRRQLLSWVGSKVEWLSLFATNKMAELSPEVAEYLPLTKEQVGDYERATLAKNEIIRESRERPESISKYERGQYLSAIDAQMRESLQQQGRYSEVEWLDAWPIERLMRVGMLPVELEQIGRWYLGIKNELTAMEKGPTSEPGRKRFLALADYLESTYYQEHPDAQGAMDQLGLEMFSEGGRYAIYHRLYGSYVGELE